MTEKKSVAAQVNWSWYPSKKLWPSFDEMRLTGPSAAFYSHSPPFVFVLGVFFVHRGGVGGWGGGSG